MRCLLEVLLSLHSLPRCPFLVNQLPFCASEERGGQIHLVSSKRRVLSLVLFTCVPNLCTRKKARGTCLTFVTIVCTSPSNPLIFSLYTTYTHTHRRILTLRVRSLELLLQEHKSEEREA